MFNFEVVCTTGEELASAIALTHVVVIATFMVPSGRMDCARPAYVYVSCATIRKQLVLVVRSMTSTFWFVGARADIPGL